HHTTFDSDDGGGGGNDPFRNDDASVSTGDAHGPGCNPDPANFDVPNNNCDDDADGKIDNAVTCDDGFQPTDDASAFAKTLGLCNKSSPNDIRWGVVSASYTIGWQMTMPPN